MTPDPVFEKVLAVGLDFMRTAFSYNNAFGRALPKLLSTRVWSISGVRRAAG